MDGYVSDMLHRFFWKLSETGRATDKEVARLIGVEMIQDFTSRDYHGFLTPCDIKTVERALYNLTGGCALPYPRINDKPIMNKLRLGDMSELAGRVESLEDYVSAYTANAKVKQKTQDGRLDKLEGIHGIETPEYDEDDEVEYGAGRKERDKGHIETLGCRRSNCEHTPPPPPMPPAAPCGCLQNPSWR